MKYDHKQLQISFLFRAKSRTWSRGRGLKIYGVGITAPVVLRRFGVQLKVRRKADGRRRAFVHGNELGQLALEAGAEAAAHPSGHSSWQSPPDSVSGFWRLGPLPENGGMKLRFS